MTVLKLRFMNTGSDPYLAIDDVNVTVINNKCNYILNGDFEQGSLDVNTPHPAWSSENGWHFLLVTDATDPSINRGGVKEDTSGNRYLYINNFDGASNIATRNHGRITLNPGRYKLSFKVKLKDTSKPLYISFAGGDVTTQDGYLNGLYMNTFGIDMRVDASFEDDWETKNVYFSVGTAFAPSITFPSLNTSGNVNEYMFDDISLTRDGSEENGVSFIQSASNRVVTTEAAGNIIKVEAITGNAVTSLSTAGDTIPVTFHYVSDKAGIGVETPVAEKLILVAALYSVDDNDIKKVESISVQTGETVIDSVTAGKNANGIINISTTLSKPDTIDENSYVSVIVMDALTMQPLFEQTNLAY